MRDVVNDLGTAVYYTTTNNWVSQNTASNSYLALQKGRSDIRVGNHVSPLPNNAYFYECVPQQFENWRNPPYERYRAKGKLGRDVGSFYGADRDENSLYMANLENEVLSKLLQKASESPIDVGVFMGELPETLTAIHESVQRILRGYKAVRKGDFKAARKAFGNYAKDLPSNLSSEWLGWSLGWKPLLSDIYGAIEYLQSEPVRERELVRIEHKKIVNVTLTSDSAYDYVGTPEKGVKAAAYYRVEDRFYVTLNKLGLLNPLAVAWELLPASFVIDYLIPVGSFLDQLTSPIGLDYAYGYKTRWTRGDNLLVRRKNGFPSSLYSNGEKAGWKVSFGQHTRSNLVDWPRPRTYIRTTGNFNQLSIVTALLMAK